LMFSVKSMACDVKSPMAVLIFQSRSFSPRADL
jgi:hypothetical protein